MILIRTKSKVETQREFGRNKEVGFAPRAFVKSDKLQVQCFLIYFLFRWSVHYWKWVIVVPPITALQSSSPFRSFSNHFMYLGLKHWACVYLWLFSWWISLCMMTFFFSFCCLDLFWLLFVCNIIFYSFIANWSVSLLAKWVFL
jgi:hypothetical protein